MKRQIILITNIPFNIKNMFTRHIHKKVFLAGYKKTYKSYKTPIIELPDKKRIWMLKYEIKYRK